MINHSPLPQITDRTSAPNFFRLNYNHGRTHSGMIAYLAELWQADNEAPLQSLIKGLGLAEIPSGTYLTPKLEYENIDLALLDEQDKPLFLLEMKVDDAEGWKKLGKQDLEKWKCMESDVRAKYFSGYGDEISHMRQTELYTLRHKMAHGENPRCAFITLGTGEYEKDFDSCGKVWKHCGLERFVEATQSIELPADELFKQWRWSLEKELSLRKNCFPGEQAEADTEEDEVEADSGDRRGLLPLMRLGRIRRGLLDRHEVNKLGYRASVYKYGANADTIMNFIQPTDQTPGGGRYCEINSNGLLNFKLMFFWKETSAEVKEKQLRLFQQELTETFGDAIKLKASGKYRKSKTAGSLNVNLQANDLLPSNGENIHSITQNIATALQSAQHLFKQTPTEA
ncbi:hypothetical protein GGR28_001798 [Lewinella aquimaris]|uniref:PD-(D/E)XK nuclease superfamily protein n=1 Tax=Neolewinella aquimaris TaxID=1835722 RepID=A0A840EAZ5_9BACT|nr:hypothetical protein [Neolewinella aquimaris]MBB4079178.1 hypothetical protein [Neolewinella aquimaris]